MTRSSPRSPAVVAVALTGALVAFLDATIVNISMPDIIHSFPRASLGDLSWVLNAYNVVFAASLMPAGRIADLWGRRRCFLLGMVVFTLASLGCAVSGNVTELDAARVVQSAGAALLVPASLAILLREYPLRRRAASVAAYGAVSAVASGIGPSLGGILVDVQGWRLVFLVNLPAGVLAAVAGWLVLTESREPAGAAFPDLPGAALLGVSIGAAAFGVVKGPDWGWSSRSVLTAFGMAIVASVIAVARIRRHPAPVVSPALLRVRSFTVANIASLVFSAGFFATLLCNVLFLTTAWRYSTLRAGLAVTPAPLAAAAVALPAGRLAERWGARIVVVTGTAAFGVGTLLYATWIGAGPSFLTRWLPVAVITGIGAGTALPTLASAALSGVPEDEFATASAANATARQVGAVIGISALVVLVGTPAPGAAVTAMDHGWIFAAVCAAWVMPLTLGLGGRTQAAAPGEARATPSA